MNGTAQVGEKEKPAKLTKKLSATEREETSTVAVKPGLVSHLILPKRDQIFFSSTQARSNLVLLKRDQILFSPSEIKELKTFLPPGETAEWQQSFWDE